MIHGFWGGGGGHVLHSPTGLMFSKLSSPNEVMGETYHPQCLCTASCFQW